MGTAKKTIVGKIHPDVLAYTVGKDTVLDLNLVEWDCIGSAAHATMLSRMPVSPRLFAPADVDVLKAELLKILHEGRQGAFEIRESDQDVHLAVERRLTEQLGDLGRRIHTGRSRNDQVAVDLRLYTRDQLLGLTDEVTELARALLRFARRHVRVPMVGRTHLQPAMPSSVGLWASAYAEALLDDLLVVEGAYAYTNRCPLGFAASYGVPLPLDRALTARLLGFPGPIHNVLHASQSRGKCESIVLDALGQVMLTLSRFAEDLILFSMPEFGYFSLPPEYCTGSSIMPQKYNPDVMELVRAKTAKVLGHATGVATLLKALPGGYNRDLQEVKELLMDGMLTTRQTLRILGLMVPGICVHPERLRGAFTPGVFATDRALEMVAEGTPWRDAYHAVRGNLAALDDADPDVAIALKTHEGATAGLDFELLNGRVKEAMKQTHRRRTAVTRALRTLMGEEI